MTIAEWERLRDEAVDWEVQGRMQKSVDCLEKALDELDAIRAGAEVLREDTLIEAQVELGIRLAVFLRKLGKSREAMARFLTAAEQSLDRHAGKDNEETAGIYFMMGGLLASIWKRHGAYDFYQKSYDMAVNCLGDVHETTLLIAEKLGQAKAKVEIPH